MTNETTETKVNYYKIKDHFYTEHKLLQGQKLIESIEKLIKTLEAEIEYMDKYKQTHATKSAWLKILQEHLEGSRNDII